jgi:serine/threonine protein kinase
VTDTISIPGYRIVRKLGQGGMATVYLAIQESLEREVALKLMSPLLNSDPSFATRFKREARIVAHMNHASIVPVFEVGEHQGHHYLTMEYLPGGDLKRRILRGERNPTLALNVCTALGGALDLAHRKGFVHRDIKPENILFREDGTPVLTDFGIARALDNGGSLTVAGVLVGTPSYMSPEQVKGLDLDGRSDLYSLGMVLYEILTGEVPFHADSTLSAALKHLSDSVPPLPEEYAHFQQFLDCLTSREREERFASGAEVIRAVRLLGSERALRERTIMRAFRTNDTPPASATPASVAIPTAQAAPPSSTAAIEERGAELPTARRPERAGVAAQTRREEPASKKATPRRTSGIQELIARNWSNLSRSFASIKATTRDKFGGRVVWIAAMGVAVLAAALVFIASGRNHKSIEAEARTVVIETPAPAVAVTQPPVGTSQPAVVAELSNQASTAPADAEPDAAAAAAIEAQTRAAEAAARKERLAEERRKRKEEEMHLAEARAAETHAAELRAQDQQVQELLAKAKSEYAAGAIWQPEGANAAEHYRIALRIQPQRPETLAGVARVGKLLAAEAERAEASGNLAMSKQLVSQLQQLQPDHRQLSDLQLRLQQLEQAPTTLSSRERGRLEKANKYIARAYEYLGRKPLDLRAAEAAGEAYDDAAATAPMAPGLAVLKDRITAAYVAAAQGALQAQDSRRALKTVAIARKRNFVSEELEDLERDMTATAAR